MKSLLAFAFLFILANAALAHTSPLPHSHEGGQTNWLPAIASFAALTMVVTVFVTRWRAASKR